MMRNKTKSKRTNTQQIYDIYAHIDKELTYKCSITEFKEIIFEILIKTRNKSVSLDNFQSIFSKYYSEDQIHIITNQYVLLDDSIKQKTNILEINKFFNTELIIYDSLSSFTTTSAITYLKDLFERTQYSISNEFKKIKNVRYSSVYLILFVLFFFDSEYFEEKSKIFFEILDKNSEKLIKTNDTYLNDVFKKLIEIGLKLVDSYLNISLILGKFPLEDFILGHKKAVFYKKVFLLFEKDDFYNIFISYSKHKLIYNSKKNLENLTLSDLNKNLLTNFFEIFEVSSIRKTMIIFYKIKEKEFDQLLFFQREIIMKIKKTNLSKYEYGNEAKFKITNYEENEINLRDIISFLERWFVKNYFDLIVNFSSGEYDQTVPAIDQQKYDKGAKSINSNLSIMNDKSITRTQDKILSSKFAVSEDRNLNRNDDIKNNTSTKKIVSIYQNLSNENNNKINFNATIRKNPNDNRKLNEPRVYKQENIPEDDLARIITNTKKEMTIKEIQVVREGLRRSNSENSVTFSKNSKNSEENPKIIKQNSESDYDNIQVEEIDKISKRISKKSSNDGRSISKNSNSKEEEKNSFEPSEDENKKSSLKDTFKYDNKKDNSIKNDSQESIEGFNQNDDSENNSKEEKSERKSSKSSENAGVLKKDSKKIENREIKIELINPQNRLKFSESESESEGIEKEELNNRDIIPVNKIQNETPQFINKKKSFNSNHLNLDQNIEKNIINQIEERKSSHRERDDIIKVKSSNPVDQILERLNQNKMNLFDKQEKGNEIDISKSAGKPNSQKIKIQAVVSKPVPKNPEIEEIKKLTFRKNEKEDSDHNDKIEIKKDIKLDIKQYEMKNFDSDNNNTNQKPSARKYNIPKLNLNILKSNKSSSKLKDNEKDIDFSLEQGNNDIVSVNKTINNFEFSLDNIPNNKSFLSGASGIENNFNYGRRVSKESGRNNFNVVNPFVKSSYQSEVEIMKDIYLTERDGRKSITSKILKISNNQFLFNYFQCFENEEINLNQITNLNTSLENIFLFNKPGSLIEKSERKLFPTHRLILNDFIQSFDIYSIYEIWDLKISSKLINFYLTILQIYNDFLLEKNISSKNSFSKEVKDKNIKIFDTNFFNILIECYVKSDFSPLNKIFSKEINLTNFYGKMLIPIYTENMIDNQENLILCLISINEKKVKFFDAKGMLLEDKSISSNYMIMLGMFFQHLVKNNLVDERFKGEWDHDIDENVPDYFTEYSIIVILIIAELIVANKPLEFEDDEINKDLWKSKIFSQISLFFIKLNE